MIAQARRDEAAGKHDLFTLPFDLRNGMVSKSPKKSFSVSQRIFSEYFNLLTWAEGPLSWRSLTSSVAAGEMKRVFTPGHVFIGPGKGGDIFTHRVEPSDAEVDGERLSAVDPVAFELARLHDALSGTTA